MSDAYEIQISDLKDQIEELEARLKDKYRIIQSLQSELTILEQDSIAKERTIEKLITKGRK